MAWADRAEEAKRAGDGDKFIEFTREALRYESEAAWRSPGSAHWNLLALFSFGVPQRLH